MRPGGTLGIWGETFGDLEKVLGPLLPSWPLPQPPAGNKEQLGLLKCPFNSPEGSFVAEESGDGAGAHFSPSLGNG